MFPARRGRVPGVSGIAPAGVVVENRILPSLDGDLFWTDLTLGRARVLFSPGVSNEMKKTYVGRFTLISRKYLRPEL